MKKILNIAFITLLLACGNNKNEVITDTDESIEINKRDIKSRDIADTCGIALFGVDSCNNNSLEKKIYKFELFRDYSLIESVITNHQSVGFGNLHEGAYIIKYEGRLNGTTINDLFLEPKRNNIGSLCFKDIAEYNGKITPFINQLNDGEVFAIKFFSYGCFHNNDSTIYISKDKGNYFLENGRDKVELTEYQKKIVEEFEHELVSRKFLGGCTTHHEYILIYKNNRIYIDDSSCNWNGFYNLIEDLSGK